MVETLSENRRDMVIGERIVDGFAVTSEFDKCRLLEYAQLVRDGALGHAEQFCDIADTKLTRGEGIEDTDARRVAKNLIKISQLI